MAPDQIFAAQMWNWPDAAIKRDANGAILFVNAAFLGLYGGQVENWQGMAVTGWNAPPAAGQSQRFETRVPSADGELVFDWIEAALPDGSALAIARNVTDILPDPGQHQAPVVPAEAAQAPVEQAAVPTSAFEFVMESTDAAAEQAAPLAAPEATTEIEAPVAETPAEPAPIEVAPVAEASQTPTPIMESGPEIEPAPRIQEPIVAAPSIEEMEAPIEPVAQTHAPIETGEASNVAEQEREFERRPLPIENESAVLGNNWRDAVIAKAVGATGAEAPQMEEAPAPDVTKVQTKEARAEGDPIRILLAEDNAINALLTRTLLEAEGCHVDTVEDGQLAVEAMRVNRYDLIFMDMRMPNMDGLDATRKIRQMDHRSKGLPIIALTANAFDDDRNACFDSGMNDFMTKPVSAEELSEMVERWTSEEALATAV
jgi:CheY-like chemotaxis protein